MQRLLQGDVGSGKTVVALYALLRAVERGHQGALMAPTETLAEQHFLTIEGLVPPSSASASSSSRARSRRRRTPQRARRSRPGRRTSSSAPTRSSRSRSSSARSRSRSSTSSTASASSSAARSPARRAAPHVLHMTATPIPRTLAQTVYGDLDVTEIARPPARPRSRSCTRLGRARAKRRGVHAPLQAPAGRPPGLRRLPARLRERDDRGAGGRGRGRAPAAARSCATSGSAACTGRLPTAERRAVMDAFKRGELDVLVATTVIEVGVDVPNATIMIVQEADRFGLAQLHQLRGRVGRGAEQSYCLLVSRPKDELTETAQARASRRSSTPPTASGSPRSTSSCAARGSCSGRASPASPISVREPDARPRAIVAQARRVGPSPRGRGRALRRRGRAGSSPMRIIAGSRKGARIFAPKGSETRPTGDRAREAAFNLIGPRRRRPGARSLRRLGRDGPRGALAWGGERSPSSSATGRRPRRSSGTSTSSASKARRFSATTPRRVLAADAAAAGGTISC